MLSCPTSSRRNSHLTENTASVGAAANINATPRKKCRYPVLKGQQLQASDPYSASGDGSGAASNRPSRWKRYVDEPSGSQGIAVRLFFPSLRVQ